MKKKDMAKVKRGVVQIPMVGGTLAFGYNKPGCDLKLTQEQAVMVAMGRSRIGSNSVASLERSPGCHSDGSGTQGLHQFHAGLLLQVDPRNG